MSEISPARNATAAPAAWLPLTALPGRRFAVLFVLLGIAVLVPLALTEVPPLVDYPNHLARMHILAELKSSPVLQRFYAAEWRPIPNLAMDAIVPLLAQIMPVALAEKLFVGATLLLLAGGAALLHRTVFGHWSGWPALAFLLLYNRVLLWGFVNFLFATGLASLALAAWIALSRRPFAVRMAVAISCGLVIYFAHLLAFGFFALMVLGYEFGEFFRGRRSMARAIAALALIACCAVPPLVILALGSPDTASGAIEFGRFYRKFDLPFSIFDNYSRTFDVICFAIAVLGMAYAYWRRWLHLAPPLVPPLILLVVAWFALPTHLFTASGADHRVPLAIALLLIAATKWEGGSALAQRCFAAVALAMFVIRLGVVAVSWHASDRLYAELLPAIDQIPVGSRVAVAFPPGAVHAEATPLLHFPALAATRRDAFVPTLFASPAQQPMAFQPAYAELARRAPAEALWSTYVDGETTADLSAALGAFDYVIFVAPRSFVVPPRPELQPIFAAPRFVLLRIVK
jgi:hypothetical protein